MRVACGGLRNGRFRQLGPLCLMIGSLSLGSPAASADAVAEWERLTTEGAWSLAAQTLGANQPEYEADPTEWEAWERRRLSALQSAEQWSALLARIATHPPQVSAAFHAWAQARAASAHLQLRQPAEARARIQTLIWSAPREVVEAQLPVWQRLVLQSYLEEDLIEDAYTALQRYRQEHDPAADIATLLLATRILLRAERGAEALADLEKSNDARARAWHGWVALHSGVSDPASAAEAARSLALSSDLSRAARHRAWLTVAEAAQRLGDDAQRVAAFEQAVALAERSEASFSAVVEALWEAYLDYGRVLAERARLDPADTQAWFETAALLREQKPLEGRAVLARLAWTGADPAYTPLAHQQFAALVSALPQGGALLEALYLHTPRFLSVESIPAIVRYRLVDLALAAGNTALVSRLLADLIQPPPGMDAVSWQLQQVRVAIGAGDVAAAMQGLTPLLEAPETLDPGFREQLFGVALDLQAVQQHDAALTLLRAIAGWDGAQTTETTDSGVSVSRLWIAMGESLRARGEHAAAARAYLSAAQLASADGWADVARERAAVALLDAGHGDDARRVYQHLLERGVEPARLALLRQRLEGARTRSAKGHP